jgi:hypothetical protein
MTADGVPTLSRADTVFQEVVCRAAVPPPRSKTRQLVIPNRHVGNQSIDGAFRNLRHALTFPPLAGYQLATTR